MKKNILLFGIAAAMIAGMCGCGRSVSYDINLDEYVTVGNYKGVEITSEEIKKEYDEAIEQIKTQYTTSSDVTDRGIKKDDVVSVDYTLKSEDTEIDNQSSYSVTVGEGKVDFDDALLDKKTDDTFTHTVTLPDDYSKTDYAGKEAVYSITVKKISESNVPEINDAFIAEKYGDTYSSLADFTEKSTENIRKNLLWDKVKSDTKFISYPENNVKVYYENYVDYYTNMYQSYANSMGTTIESIYSMFGTSLSAIYEQSADAAVNDVENELIALSIAEKENITVDDAAYDEKIEELYSTYGYESAKEMQKALGKDAVKRIIINNLVIDLINDSATVK